MTILIDDTKPGWLGGFCRIEVKSPTGKIGIIQATNSFITWVGILMASGFIWLNASGLGNPALKSASTKRKNNRNKGGRVR